MTLLAAAVWGAAGAVGPAAARAQGPVEEPQAGVDDFSLGPISPNPFAGETRISFRLGEGLFAGGQEVRVTLRVFNILHQLVAVPMAHEGVADSGGPIEDLAFDRPGLYQARWDGRDMEGRVVTEGPYFVELTVGDRSQVRKILLLR